MQEAKAEFKIKITKYINNSGAAWWGEETNDFSFINRIDKVRGISSDEGLTLEPSALESLYGGQITKFCLFSGFVLLSQ